MRHIRDDIEARYNELSSLLVILNKKTQSLPDGRINIKHINGGTYFYKVVNGNVETVLDKNNDKLIHDLAQKNYYEKAIRTAEKELSVLKRALDHYPQTVPEDVFELLTEERKKLVTPIILTDDQYLKQWLEKPYEQKGFKEETPFYTTLKGERVRSKSEQIGADRLYINGIPYKYECPLKINNKIIFPDFTILRMSDRKELYWEHFGMMDDPQYADNMVRKMNSYTLANIYQGDRLFSTYETGNTPLDTRVIDRMINEFFK